MKSEKNILIAFVLNLVFSIFEFIGGIFTNSISIISDSIHDIADALSIGLCFILEKKSKQKPDEKYTYGYTRYSALGAVITTTILLVGSILVILSSIKRLINPVSINYNGMIIFAVIGVIINILATYFTKGGNSINQKSVNLHMLEDVFGWSIVLIGAVIMKFTDIVIIDPILSIVVAIFILIHAFKHLKEIIDLFLEKTPSNISIKKIKNHLLDIDNVIDVHHIHIWSIDGVNNYATMHVVTNDINIKEKIKKELKQFNINHTTIEIENENEECHNRHCHVDNKVCSHHH